MITGVTDQDGDSITQYAFYDSGSGCVQFAVSIRTIGVTRVQSCALASLSGLTYVGGSAAGSETLYVDATDGKDYGTFVGLTATTTASKIGRASCRERVKVAADQATAK